MWYLNLMKTYELNDKYLSVYLCDYYNVIKKET